MIDGLFNMNVFGDYLLVLLVFTLSITNYGKCVYVVNAQATKYDPTWDSLDTRPLPSWFDKAKFGIFLHWGVYSVPSFGSEWFWTNWKGNSSKYVEFMSKNYPPNFTYQDFAKDYTAEFFNATEWAQIFKKSGAKYVVLTSKHHEGYTLWPSKYSFSWNSMDVGPHKDLVGELAEAIRKVGLHFGVYHSLYEWYNPLYLSDKSSNFSKSEFVRFKLIPEMVELIENYKPDILWSDGDWEANDTYWESTKFLAWLYNDSPVKDNIVVNDRWGIGIPCKHGDFYNCEDRFNPGEIQDHKWENAMTIDKHSWGFRRNANLDDYFNTSQLLKTMLQTVSCYGNLLMNVGPTKDGIIAPIFQQRLEEMGDWLKVNAEAIFETSPWSYPNDTLGDVWYTTNRKSGDIYATVFTWPENGYLPLKRPVEFMNSLWVIGLLGHDKFLNWYIKDEILNIQLPQRQSARSNYAWAIRFRKLN